MAEETYETQVTELLQKAQENMGLYFEYGEYAPVIDVNASSEKNQDAQGNVIDALKVIRSWEGNLKEREKKLIERKRELRRKWFFKKKPKKPKKPKTGGLDGNRSKHRKSRKVFTQ